MGTQRRRAPRPGAGGLQQPDDVVHLPPLVRPLRPGRRARRREWWPGLADAWRGQRVSVSYKVGLAGVPADRVKRIEGLLQLAAQALARHLEQQPPLTGEPVFRNAGGVRPGAAAPLARPGAAAATPPTASLGALASLRALAISSLIRGHVDLRTVMSIAGHTSIEETCAPAPGSGRTRRTRRRQRSTTCGAQQATTEAFPAGRSASVPRHEQAPRKLALPGAAADLGVDVNDGTGGRLENLQAAGRR